MSKRESGSIYFSTLTNRNEKKLLGNQALFQFLFKIVNIYERMAVCAQSNWKQDLLDPTFEFCEERRSLAIYVRFQGEGIGTKID